MGRIRQAAYATSNRRPVNAILSCASDLNDAPIFVLTAARRTAISRASPEFMRAVPTPVCTEVVVSRGDFPRLVWSAFGVRAVIIAAVLVGVTLGQEPVG